MQHELVLQQVIPFYIIFAILPQLRLFDIGILSEIYQRTPYNMTASTLQMKDEIRVTFGNDILYLCMTYTKFCEVLTNIIEH